MVDEHIVRAIADMACFLEFSGSKIIDDDASVAAMEQLSYQLKQVNLKEKNEISRILINIAPSYRDQATFVHSLPESLGLC